MPMHSHYALLADYNQWMNRKLYDAAAKLPHEALIADRGAFFKSILGTLNHLVVADTIWLKRFRAHPSHPEALASLDDIPTPSALDAMPYPDLAQLREQRERLDQIILAWTDSLDEAMLGSALDYTSMQGVAARRVVPAVLAHFFNHQTHHRGQVTTLLSQAGADVGVTDLLVRTPNALDS